MSFVIKTRGYYKLQQRWVMNRKLLQSDRVQSIDNFENLKKPTFKNEPLAEHCTVDDIVISHQ